MLDLRSDLLAPHVTRRADYTPPDWLVPGIALDFDLAPERTLVRATLHVQRSDAHDRPLKLDGGGQTLLSVSVDGKAINDWVIEDGALVLQLTGRVHIVETAVELAPERNTQLMGLYASGGNLCTQCEAEGFRRITFFPDRPDYV